MRSSSRRSEFPLLPAADALRSLVVALVPATALAAAPEVPLPAKAERVLHCRVAETCARDASVLFERVIGAHAPALSASSQATLTRERTGLALQEPAALARQGVDAARSWTEFTRPDGTWLAVFVRDRAAFAAAMDSWAAARGLASRESLAARGFAGALYSRTVGTRPAAGWALARDRAVILLQSAGAPDAAAALRAIEDAAPATPPVDGTWITYERNWRGAREAWFGVRLRPDGADLVGRLLGLESGVFSGASTPGWVAGAFADAPGAVRSRATLGPAGAARLADAVAARLPLAGESGATWRAAFARLAVGPVELLVPSVNVEAIGLDADALDPLSLGPPWLRLPARAGAAELFALSRRSLAGAVSIGADTLRTAQGASPATVVKRGDDLWLGLGTRESSPPAVADGPARGALSCGRGSPVATLRVDGPRAAESLGRTSLMTLLRGGGLGAVAAGAELGGLLAASEPADLLVCREAGAIAIQGRWRVVAP
jgi:hypothetical protein